MPATIADLRAKVSVDGAEKAKKDLADLKGSSGSSGGGILGLADSFKMGLGAVTGFVAGFEGFKLVGDALGFVKDQLLDVLQAGMDQQAVMAQTAAVIKSTGGAAHISAEQVGDLADSLAQMSGVSDDTIQGAENILLTFDKINKNIFPQTTQLVLDLSTAFHQDLQSSAVMVGKALQDPIQGVTALRRVGVQLSDNEVDLVKKFMATGQIAKAQGVIMGELTRQVGGSAEAYGKTLPGMLARLNVSWDQAKEKIALAVIPILQSLLDKYVMPLADWLGKFLPVAITTLTGFLNNQLVPAINSFMQLPFVKTVEGWELAIVNHLFPQLNLHLPDAANKSKNAVKSVDGQLNTMTTNASTTYVDRIQKAIGKLDGMTDSLGGTAPTGKGLNPAVIRVNQNLDKMDTQLNANAAATAKNRQQQQQSIPVISGIGDVFGHAKDKIGQFVDDLQTRLPGAMPQIDRFKDYLGHVFGPGGFLDGLQTFWQGFWAFLSLPVRVAFDSVHTFFNVGLDVLQGDFTKAGKDVQKGTDQLRNDFLDGLKGLGKMLIGPFEAIFKGWGQALLNLPDLLSPDWKKALHDLANMITVGLHNLAQHMVDEWNSDMSNAVHNLPGIGNFVGPGSQHGHAAGTLNAPPGLAWVGEQGPELMAFRGGEQVFSHQQSVAMASQYNSNAAVPARSGNTYVTNVYPQQANLDTAELARIQRRRELLIGMY